MMTAVLTVVHKWLKKSSVRSEQTPKWLEPLRPCIHLIPVQRVHDLGPSCLCPTLGTMLPELQQCHELPIGGVDPNQHLQLLVPHAQLRWGCRSEPNVESPTARKLTGMIWRFWVRWSHYLQNHPA